jgi:O-methyltransferase
MMVSPDQHSVILGLLGESLSEPGDVVEAGCNAGSTSRLLADYLLPTDLDLHLFDSFEGLPEETGLGGLMAESQETLEAAICDQCGSDQLPEFVKVHPGWFSVTMPSELPDQICFAFIDCDVFESVMDSLPPILNRLTGSIAIHDFTHPRWEKGVRRAVNLFDLNVTERNGMAIIRKVEQC